MKRFIFDYIGSVQQLEALLVLSSAPEKEWTPEAVAARLEINATSVANRLIVLLVKGLLTAKEIPGLVYQYKPKDAEIEKTVSQLSEIYKKHRLQVIDLIAEKSTSPIRDFSDSFKIREDEDRG